jgi:hypothetical protein
MGTKEGQVECNVHCVVCATFANRLTFAVLCSFWSWFIFDLPIWSKSSWTMHMMSPLYLFISCEWCKRRSERGENQLFFLFKQRCSADDVWIDEEQRIQFAVRIARAHH